MTKVYAHRGASAIAPENTLEAFDLAVKMGCDGVELDVLPTNDGAVVVIHDETIDKVSNGRGFVWQKNLSELKSYDFSFDKPKYSGAKIPTLDEVLDLLKNTDLIINIEIKDSMFTLFKDFTQKLLTIQKSHGLSHERIVYSSFNHMTLKELAKIEPSANLGMLYSEVIIEPWKYVKQIPTNVLHPHFSSVSLIDGYVENCNNNGVKIRTWTVDDVNLMEKFIKMDIDAIMSNTPDVALKVRDSLKNLA